MSVRVLPEARADAEEAAIWMEARQPGLGVRFLDLVSRSIEELADNPRRFPQNPTVRTRREVRRQLLVPKFAYKIVFEMQGDDVIVLSIVHTSRRPGVWKSRLKR